MRGETMDAGSALVCLRVSNCINGHTSFYTIDLPADKQPTTKKNKTVPEKKKNEKAAAALPASVNMKLHEQTVFVYHNRAVYCIGGGYDPEPEDHHQPDDDISSRNKATVDMVHLGRSQLVDDQLPPMTATRLMSAGVVHGKCLYVFGGTESDNAPWGECFHLQKGYESGWKSLKEPPVRYDDVYAVSVSDRLILVGPINGSGRLFFYDSVADDWTDSGRKSPAFGRGRTPIVVEDGDDDVCLYWVSGDVLYGYSFKSDQYYYGYLECLSEYVSETWHGYPGYEPPLEHLGGGMFCTFTMEKKSRPEDGSTTLTCFTFQANKLCANERSLEVTPCFTFHANKLCADERSLEIIPCHNSPTSYAIEESVTLCDARLLYSSYASSSAKEDGKKAGQSSKNIFGEDLRKFLTHFKKKRDLNA